MNIYGAPLYNSTFIKNLPLSLPPLEQQKSIASFLDQKCDLIQQLFQKIDLFLKKLEEYQEALLYKLFQKNYSSSSKLKYLLQLYPSYKLPLTENESFSFIPMDHLKQGFHFTSQLSSISSNTYHVFQNGDLLLAKVTPCFENGNIAIASIPTSFGYCSTEIFVLSSSQQQVFLKYLFYCFQNPFLKSFWISSMVGSSGLKRIDTTTFLNTVISYPSLAEQQELCTFLDHKRTLFTKLQHHYDSLKVHLKEYQESLLYETFQNLS